MKRIHILALTVASTLAFTGPSMAQDPAQPAPEPRPGAKAAATTATPAKLWANKSRSTLGLGAGTSLAGTGGVIVHKFLTATWGVQGVVGIALLSATIEDLPSGGETERSGNRVTIGGYAVQQIRTWNRAALSGVYGIEFASVSLGTGDGSNRSSDFALSGGAIVDWFILPGVSVWAQTGLRVLFLGENSAGGGTDSSRRVIKLGPDSMPRMFGMTWWM